MTSGSDPAPPRGLPPNVAGIVPFGSSGAPPPSCSSPFQPLLPFRISRLRHDASGDPTLADLLARIVERERILTRPIDLIACASDASFYRLIPRAVVLTRSIEEIRALCGFSGGRGFLFPELTESATRREAAEVQASRHDGYFSSSRTCEIGMTRATGQIYRSYLYLLEHATHP